MELPFHPWFSEFYVLVEGWEQSSSISVSKACSCNPLISRFFCSTSCQISSPPTALHPKIMLKIEGTVVMLEESCSLPRFEIQRLLWIFHLISPVTKALSVYYR